jgi:uncharacterized protein YqhQ
MDRFVSELARFKDVTSAFTLMDVALALSLSFVLASCMAWIYRSTHRGTSYAQSFAQTLVMMSMVTTLVMLIIGSDIARAFTLVGALSVIRFRNALKEARDVGYMFVAMAVGMACGTRFYALAMFAAIVLGIAILVMARFDFFEKRLVERLLRIQLPSGNDHEGTLESVFREMLAESRLVSAEYVPGGALQELVFSVVPRRGVDTAELIEAIRRVNGNNKVTLVVGQHEVDL